MNPINDYTYMLVVGVGSLLNLAGFAGCFIPVLPGPTLNLLALVLLFLTAGPDKVSIVLMVAMTFLVLLALAMDNIFPIITARAGGSSRHGTLGATLGLLVGFFFFPPFGMVLGAFSGAVIGEYYRQRSHSAAVKAGVATLVGFGLALAMKLAVSAVICWYFFLAVLG